MFRNLRTSTKLIILCATCFLAIGVTVINLVAEKQLAIDFARQELIGNRYLAAVREAFAAILRAPVHPSSGAQQSRSFDDTLDAVSTAGRDADGVLQTAEFREALTTKLRELREGKVEDQNLNTLVIEAAAAGRQLAVRIGDDSNLALDPDLDSYYVQNIVVTKLPAFLAYFGEIRMLANSAALAPADSSERWVRFHITAGLLRSIMDEIAGNLAAAYRGNLDRGLRRAIDDEFATMMSHARSYLSIQNVASTGPGATEADPAPLNQLYATTVGSAIRAWASAQAELDGLLRGRIERLQARLILSLGLIGALAGLSILIAVMTHRHIVRPLERFEHTASNVRKTKNYNLRIDYNSRDEIGRLAVAFNEMLSELAGARERELSKQSELAHDTRLTTMGAMAASLAHEINQPLAAIVTSSNAGLRWLTRAVPDLEEARAALQRIASDGHRASQVIGSIRAIFRKGSRDKTEVDMHDLVREVLSLVEGDLRRLNIVVRTELTSPFLAVLADQVQLQQVILNLITNAADAMRPVADRVRLLRLASGTDEFDRVWLEVEDSGTGIAPEARERIFDAFFTTKSSGMGLGLSICRSIVEAHGGQLSASPGNPHGSLFKVVLPTHNPAAAR